MEAGTTETLGFILLLLLFLFISFRVSTRQGPGRLPPGPAPLPLLGNLTHNVLPLYCSYRRGEAGCGWSTLSCGYSLSLRAPEANHVLKQIYLRLLNYTGGQEGHRKHKGLCQEYGPVFTVWLGHRPAVVFCGPEVLHEALLEHSEEFGGRKPILVLEQAAHGYGLVNSNGERWRQLRRFTLTTLRNLGMGKKTLEQQVREEARHLAQAVTDKQGREFNPQTDLSLAVANIICCVLFGTRFSSDNKDFQELLHVIKSFMRYFRSVSAQWYNIFSGIMSFLPGRHRKCFRDYERLKVFMRAQVASHRHSLDPSTPRDLIDYFLLRQAQERGQAQTEFGDENLTALALSLFIAGLETTSNTIQFALLVLSKFPDIQARVQQELDKAVGRARPPAMEDRLRLPYTNAMLHELQRYLDLVPLSLPHATTRPTTFRGYHIPKGTTVIPLLTSAHFDPASWESPEDFNPAHFLDENGAFRKRNTAMPFSAGKRMCPGEGLAKVEIFLFVTTLLQNFTLELLTDPAAIDLALLRRAFRDSGLAYKLRAVPRPV